jgi:hypothetical protein
MLGKLYFVSTYLCPISWATVNAVESPVSSFTIQLLNSLHIPSIGAKPENVFKKYLHFNYEQNKP